MLIMAYFGANGEQSQWPSLAEIKTFTRHIITYLMSFNFIQSFGMCRMRRFLYILRGFFHSSLLCIFSCHPSPPIIRPSSLISYCCLFLGLLLSLYVFRFIYNTLLGILFSSILCTCPNQCNRFNLTVSL